MSRANEFRIVTRWEVEAAIADVADVLMDADRFPDWWSEVYLGIRVLAPGDADGIGRRVAIDSKGWLPYRLNWVATLTAADLPHRWSVAAEGDLTGHGEWRLTQRGAIAEIVYDWAVAADKPVLRLLSPVLAPVFAWNHRWAMAKGLAGLRHELARRAAQPSGMPAARNPAT